MGSGPIWLDEVKCSPGMSNISECIHNGLNNSDCTHSEDVGIKCEGNNNEQCTLYFTMF